MRKMIFVLLLFLALPAFGQHYVIKSTNSWITVANEDNLSAERALAVALGLALTDGGINSTLTVAFDYSATLAGNPALAASRCMFAATGIICEGSTANTSETIFQVVDPTADRTITYPDATGTVLLDTAGSVGSAQLAETLLKYSCTDLTNAELLAVRATPKTLVAAVGSGKDPEFVSAKLYFNRVQPYTDSADNLVIRYNNTTGTIVSQAIEFTGFLDAASDASTSALPKIDAITTTAGELSNGALVLHNSGDGEYGGGDAANTLKVCVAYRVHTTGL